MKKFLIFSSLILFLAFLLRLKLFINGDFFFFVDQSRDLLLVKQIVEEGKIMLIGARTGVGGIFHGPLWIYSLVPSFILAQGEPFKTLVPIFLTVGVGTVLGGLLVGYKLYGKAVALIFALFLAISLPLNEAVFFTTNAQVMPLILLPYIYFIIRYLRGSENSLILAMFFAGVGFHFEAAFCIALIPITLIALFIRKNTQIKTVGLAVVAFLIAISNFLIFDLRHNFLTTNSVLRLITGGNEPLKGYEQYQNIAFRFGDRIYGYLDSFKSILYANTTLTDTLTYLIVFFAVILLIRKYRNKKLDALDKEYIFLLSIPIVTFILYVFYPFPLWVHYTLSVIVFTALILAVSIKRVSSHKLGVIVASVLVIAATIPAIVSINVYYKSPLDDNLSSDSSYKNQLSVANWIIEDSKGKPFSYLVFIPSTFTYGMDYLFTWDKLAKDKEITKCKKTNLTYLIYYPHLEGDEGAFSFWKENVIKTKIKPTNDKLFPGNILVERLDLNKDEGEIDPNYCQNLNFR